MDLLLVRTERQRYRAVSQDSRDRSEFISRAALFRARLRSQGNVSGGYLGISDRCETLRQSADAGAVGPRLRSRGKTCGSAANTQRFAATPAAALRVAIHGRGDLCRTG